MSKISLALAPAMNSVDQGSVERASRIVSQCTIEFKKENQALTSSRDSRREAIPFVIACCYSSYILQLAPWCIHSFLTNGPSRTACISQLSRLPPVVTEISHRTLLHSISLPLFFFFSVSLSWPLLHLELFLSIYLKRMTRFWQRQRPRQTRSL